MESVAPASSACPSQCTATVRGRGTAIGRAANLSLRDVWKLDHDGHVDWSGVASQATKMADDRAATEAIRILVQQRANIVKAVTRSVNDQCRCQEPYTEICEEYVEWAVADALIGMIERGSVDFAVLCALVEKRALCMLQGKSYLGRRRPNRLERSQVSFEEWGRENQSAPVAEKQGISPDQLAALLDATALLLQGAVIGDRELRPERPHKAIVFVRIRLLDDAPHGALSVWAAENADLRLSGHYEIAREDLLQWCDESELDPGLSSAIHKGMDCLGRRIEDVHPGLHRPYRETTLRDYCPGGALTTSTLDHWLDDTRARLRQVLRVA